MNHRRASNERFDRSEDDRSMSARDRDEDAILSQLGPIGPGPDLTRTIMGKLGYMAVPPKVARRHRLRRWGSRLGILCSAAIAIGLGIRVFQSSDQMRRPVGPTIPAALQNDLEQQQNRIGTVIRLIRDLPPKFELQAAPDGEPLNQEAPPQPLNDDVNRSPSSFVRWV